MEIVVVGRHTDVADRFRQHVEEKLAKVELLSPYVRRVDVEVTRENNPRLSENRERVELTLRAKGPVIRAEAAADDRFGALDLAIDKLNERLRRARDRRKDHRNNTVVPPVDVRPLDEILEDQVAHKIDRDIVRLDHTMRLENQALTAGDVADARRRLVGEALRGSLRGVWDA